MRQYICPSCGAEIGFRSSISVSCVCQFCKSLVVRRDKDVEAFGQMAELPDDISPFQIGTSGKFGLVTFTIIGRMKIGWEDGCWNEWFLYFDDGKRGWLAEAQGTLAISFEKTDQVPLAEPPLGEVIYLDKIPFTVTDIKSTECVGMEGELPIVAQPGRKARMVDLMTGHGDFASIEYAELGPARVYVGTYVEFDECGFSNLRDLPGWKISRPATTPTARSRL